MATNASPTKASRSVRRPYYYYRATGMRLPADPNSTAFKLALEGLNRQVAADKAPPAVVPTIGSLTCRPPSSRSTPAPPPERPFSTCSG